MSEFEYKVSVIVPVYNVEQYLRDCLDSLLAQTIDHDQMEVLLINDGSTDNSLAICEEYAALFSCFKVFSQENAGVSAARNVGLLNASGKYIMFLDSDDMFAPETVKAATDYFDSIYQEVDLVTFKRVFYKKGKAQPLHFRYNYLNKTGIYDLNQFKYISQTTLNVVVKNNKNTLFDTSLSQGEDQKYITEFTLDKMRIAYCQNGEYIYLVRDGSAVQNESYSFYLFEQITSIWEDFFNRFDKVPQYVQALVLANYYWQLTSDCIFPYHYKNEKYVEAIQRIKNILNKIDVDVLMEHPKMDMFHKHFFLSMKENAYPTVAFEKEKMSVVVNGKVIYSRNNMEIILNKVDIENSSILIMGFVKSPVYNYINDVPELICVYNGNCYNVQTFDSINSHYKTKARTNNFFGFYFSRKCSDKDELYFMVRQDGIIYPVSFYCVSSAVFNKKKGIDSFVRCGYLISLNANVIYTSKISDNERIHLELTRKFPNDPSSELYQIRNEVINSPAYPKVWLYSDSNSVGVDNAFYQFQHDFEKNDGILRYYVCDNNRDEIMDFFTNEQAKHIVEYGTRIHKILFLRSEYVLTSFMDIRPKTPFSNDEEYSMYRDLKQPKIICLQHGVLHADLRWLQSAERCRADKVVVSSEFERKNYINRYHYRDTDVLGFGMPRYDLINREQEPKNRILFAPSWRSYLLKKNSNAVWEKNIGQLMKSNYFKKFTDFLKSEHLAKILEENDLFLDAKLHPHMKSVLDCFDLDSNRITITTNHVSVEDYKIFITDISSYVFDYAYLCRPVIYFMPDMEEFESGMNHYRKLDLPWEDAFGNLALEPEEAIDEIERIIDNAFLPDPVFKERMDNFYLPMGNCREDLYSYLVKADKENMAYADRNECAGL